MDNDTLTDLKQFISATISQHMTEVATKDDVARLEHKIDVMQAAIDESVLGYISSVDDQVQGHESRLTLLEQA